MEKIRIKEEMIKDYLQIEDKFSSIEEFCDFLLKKENSSNIKLGLMDLYNLLRNDQRKQGSLLSNIGNLFQGNKFREYVEWIRNNCEIEVILEEIKEIVLEEVKEVVLEEKNVNLKKVKDNFVEFECKNITCFAEEELDYTDNIILHEGGIITQQNKVQIYLCKDGLELDESKILIVKKEIDEVIALGYLILEEKDVYTVVFDNKEYIDYKEFTNIRQARFVVYDKEKKLYSRCIELEYQPFAVEMERPLCIDFGTSNTSAGSYGIKDRKKDEVELVQFIDVTANPVNTQALLLPTIIYVEDCSDENNIKYLFGYEAKKKIEEERYESKASVYYEIKRWMSSADEKEIIRDNNNNKAEPFRKQIIKAYVDYVIEHAEQYFATRFHKIHFSAPIKLKEQFISVFSELYGGEKQVLSVEESIDEGIAIVYNKIITLMYQNNKIEDQDEPKSIMIMDCGGGTTDLASCEYTYQRTNAGVELKLETCFENGNSNFGGNNITYRIMQLLKIKIAAKLCKDFIEYDGRAIELIGKSENEILGLIEQNMKNGSYDSDNANVEVYGKFLENYEKAETIIPTKYNENKYYKKTDSITKMIKRNFYYLWLQAEKIKIEFYKTEKVLMEFKDKTEDAQIDIKSDDNYYLYVSDNPQELKLRKEEKPFENISITIKEINRVICGDIYSLLVDVFQDGELTSKKKQVDDFDYYKLSGQSCKISLFSELIKEYVPGRKLRPVTVVKEKRNSEDLKLDCVRGCINYVKDQIRPEMKVITIPNFPRIIYDIRLKGNYHKDDKMMFDNKDINDIKIEVCHENTKEYPLEIIGKDKKIEREFIFNLEESKGIEDFQTTEDIRKKLRDSSIVSENGIENFINDLADNVRKTKENVNIVFIVPAKQGYGVWIGQIWANNTEDGSRYRLLQYKYENFEDSSKTFFDGRR